MAVITSPLAYKVIGCAIEVHRALGPGLLESAYEECLCRELSSHNVPFIRQMVLPVHYKGAAIDCGYRADLVVDDTLLVEFKSAERVLPLHHAQVITYLRLSGFSQALLINFNVTRLTSGLKSFLYDHSGLHVSGASTPDGEAP